MRRDVESLTLSMCIKIDWDKIHEIKYRKYFLFDGAGALLSFLGTGLIFPIFSRDFGIPAETFYLLATFPLIYCIYSFACHFLISQKKLWMLKLIMAANLFYCLFSFVTLLRLNEVTSIGRIVTKTNELGKLTDKLRETRSQQMADELKIKYKKINSERDSDFYTYETNNCNRFYTFKERL